MPANKTKLLLFATLCLLAWATNLPSAKAQNNSPDVSKGERLYLEGLKYDIMGLTEKALPFYEKAADRIDNNHAILFKIAEANAKLQKWDKAQKYAEKAINAYNQNPFYYVLMAEIEQKLGNHKATSKTLEKLIKLEPDNKEHYHRMAVFLYETEQYDEALNLMERQETRFGPDPEHTFRKQHILLKQNKIDKAIAEGEKLIEAYPESFESYITLAELMVSNDRWKQAKQLLEKVLEKWPNESSARLALAEIYFASGETELAKKHLKIAFADPNLELNSKIKMLIQVYGYQEKAAAATEGLEIAKLLTQTHPNQGDAYTVLGDMHNLNDNLTQARDAYLQAAHLGNNIFEVWQKIIMLDFRLDQNDSLLAHTRRATELFPNQGSLWFYKGNAEMIAKNYQQAVKDFKYGKEQSLFDLSLVNQFNAQLGDAYFQSGEHQKAFEAYENVLKHNPDNTHVLNNYSYFLSVAGKNLNKALQMSTRLIKLRPNEATFLDTHGWVLYKSQKYKEALEYLEKAAQQTNDGTVLEHYADALYKNGQTQKAIEYWQKAKQSGSDQTSSLLDKKIADGKLYE